MEINPYESPILPADSEMDWPASGIFRWGNLLLKHETTPFPAICMQTCRTANAVAHIDLTCSGNNDGSIRHPKTQSFGQRVFHFEIPVHRQWLGRQIFALKISLVLFVTGVILVTIGLFSGILFHTLTNLEWDSFFSWIQLVMLVFGAISVLISGSIQDYWKPLQKLVRIEQGFYFFKGAAPDYLAQLPDWPVAKNRPEKFWGT
jgi:hypothetical protein